MVEYYCDSCAKANDLKRGMRKTLHKCKFCGMNKLCSDDRPPKDFSKGKKK